MTEDSRGQNPKLRGAATAASLMAILFLATLVPLLQVSITPRVMASPDPEPATAAPTKYWGPFFGTSGDVQIDVNQPGIAVRVEIPREYLTGVITKENDTHFVVSDIRNDYYYYSVVDESRHWSYAWNGTDSNAPCFKPQFSIYDPNAPWCVEIWNYLNGTFKTFTPPKFVRFIGLNSPTVAGVYNFTLFVADHTNSLGLPDFVHAWNKTLLVPVSMNDNPASISGTICDADVTVSGCVPILAKGVVYALNQGPEYSGQEAMAYVNQTKAPGFFNLTGLAPGTYWVTGSAGVFNGVAYSLSGTSCIPNTPGCYDLVPSLGRGGHTGVELYLKRAPQVCGVIDYHSSGGGALSHSLTDHPYLETVGIRRLNVTVEATDPSHHVYRYMANTTNTEFDSYRIITGNGTKYVGLDPYGTEFAGLPSVTTPLSQMSVNVWVTGYLQESSPPVTVNTGPGLNPPFLCNQVSPVVMETGGVITGTIQLLSSPPVGIVHLETPHDAEVALGLTPTDALFGGNILIRTYDHTGVLRGVTVLNGTLPDGRTCYASPALSLLCRIKITSPATIQFYIIGFSEFYNRTTAGTWGAMDYGLPDDQGYQINVQIRGYEQYTTEPITLLAGSNQTMSIRMVRGGAIQIAAYSYDNRPGTRAIQALMPFRFATGLPGGFTISARARVYVYDSADTAVGYIERLIAVGVPCTPLSCGLVAPNFFQGVFAGQNWSLREIWFFHNATGGDLQPTHLTADTYSVSGYTLGYVQQGPVSTPMRLGGFAGVRVILFLGNEIDLTVPVFFEPSLFGIIPEHDHALAQTSVGGLLQGAVNGNLTAGIATLDFPIFGFGAMVQNTTLNGQGHFFYVSRDGVRFFDYGLDLGTYTTQLPEFGFNRHFTTLGPVPASFSDLFLESGVFLNLLLMARISSSTGLVMGWCADLLGQCVLDVVPLSWVTVQAANATNIATIASAPTLDGQYVGVGALFLPAGTFTITFSVGRSVAFYEPQNTTLTVNWGDDHAVLPPLQYLCPTAGSSHCTDPPAHAIYASIFPPPGLVNASTHSNVSVVAKAVTRAIFLNGTHGVELAKIAINASSNGQLIRGVAFNESVARIDFDHDGAVVLTVNSSAKPTAVFADDKQLSEAQSAKGLNPNSNTWVYDQNHQVITIFADPSSITLFYGPAPTPVPEFPSAMIALLLVSSIAAAIFAVKTKPRRASFEMVQNMQTSTLPTEFLSTFGRTLDRRNI